MKIKYPSSKNCELIKKEDKIMVNFIGPLIILSGIASVIGIITGLVKKNKKILIISLVVFAIVASIFLLEGFLLE